MPKSLRFLWKCRSILLSLFIFLFPQGQAASLQKDSAMSVFQDGLVLLPGHGVLRGERTDLLKLLIWERDKNKWDFCPCLQHRVLRRKRSFSTCSFCGWGDFYSTVLTTDGNLHCCYLQCGFFPLPFGASSGGCVHCSSNMNAVGKRALSSSALPGWEDVSLGHKRLSPQNTPTLSSQGQICLCSGLGSCRMQHPRSQSCAQCCCAKKGTLQKRY